MPNQDPYKVAPTWLFNEQGDTKLFNTQEEVDSAWESGWFGPPWLMRSAPLLSGLEWTKNQLASMVATDARYAGFKVNTRRNVEELRSELVEYEVARGLKDVIVGEE